MTQCCFRMSIKMITTDLDQRQPEVLLSRCQRKPQPTGWSLLSRHWTTSSGSFATSFSLPHDFWDDFGILNELELTNFERNSGISSSISSPHLPCRTSFCDTFTTLAAFGFGLSLCQHSLASTLTPDLCSLGLCPGRFLGTHSTFDTLWCEQIFDVFQSHEVYNIRHDIHALLLLYTCTA